MSLQSEIEKARQEIKTDDYPMSLGELSSIYKAGELKINPNYQRLFRWSTAQKSAFFESILVGIPIPPIFVFELDNGHWELIDGLQRMSTLFEFQGILVGPDGRVMRPSTLSKTEYLPSLKGAVWDAGLDAEFLAEQDIGAELRIWIKRAKIGLQILKKGSEERSKYDLFQRLNGNGSPLSAQEFRTCVMVMLNEDKFKACEEMAKDEDFLALLNLSDSKLEKQENLDYVCRFLAHYTSDLLKQYDVDEFITHIIKELFIDHDIAPELNLIRRTASFLNGILGAEALKRYEKGSFSGRVGKVGFEGIFLGVAKNIDAIEALDNPKGFLLERLDTFWTSKEVESVLGPGIRGTARIEKTVPLGRAHFAP